MIEDFIVPFLAVALAELGDKTQLSILLLSSKTKKHAELLFGVLLAFLVVDGIAVALGSWITGIVPVGMLKILSAIVFVLFGILMLLHKDDENGDNASVKNPFATGFAVIFMAELGDKTQIAAGLFSTRYNPVMVLLGTLAALALLSVV
ncbi:MAG: TMEM165/GDT1 family protein, partial [Candidatus Altiarchaeota archaeon]|nr:TMEM165/GDT1 family protein [Candidatus Altiarchaeota archaeon]